MSMTIDKRPQPGEIIDHKHERFNELAAAFLAQNSHLYKSQIHHFESTEDGGFTVVSWSEIKPVVHEIRERQRVG